ncbi:fibronectin type III domain-containing protein [Nocardioides sp. CN2-186]|uniref:fibronectin type III domain-containing protein n=1 Tax=Nocardioides tweenelious TaxID=3156607 RepID=UPI0032B4FA98
MGNKLRGALTVALALAVTSGMTVPSALAQVDPAGSSIKHAAAVNDMSVARLSTILRTDPTAALTDSGRLFYTDVAPSLEHRGRFTAANAPYPLDQTFALHSNPGSNRTIFLDFDGTDDVGSEWGVPDNQPAWTIDGNASTFNATEQAAVQAVWQQVSEDYAPFDVDVTTEDQGDAVIDRSGSGDQQYGAHVLIGPSPSAADILCPDGCGGIAILGAFDQTFSHQQEQPAWVFSQYLTSETFQASDAKYLAEAATHEVGHQLSLSHDGTAKDPDYYEGHGSWAPIMGAGYYQPIVQWSQGDYPGANNHEDDLAMIASHGLSYRADEAGGTIATASGLPSGTAYVTTRSDKDFYDLGECEGALTIDAEVAPVSPDLDIELRLYDGDGNLVASDNPTSTRVSDFVASGMSASISTEVDPGDYVVSVDGVGNGTPANGYDDYASIGAYTLTSSCGDVDPDPDPTVDVPGAPTIGRASPGARGGQVTATARWAAPLDDGGAAVDGYVVSATRWKNGFAVRTLSSNVLKASTHAASFVLGRGVWSFRVQARNSEGFGAFSPASKRVTAR